MVDFPFSPLTFMKLHVNIMIKLHSPPQKKKEIIYDSSLAPLKQIFLASSLLDRSGSVMHSWICVSCFNPFYCQFQAISVFGMFQLIAFFDVFLYAFSCIWHVVCIWCYAIQYSFIIIGMMTRMCLTLWFMLSNYFFCSCARHIHTIENFKIIFWSLSRTRFYLLKSGIVFL